MFKRKLEEDLKKVVGELGYQVDDIVCDIPKNPSFGDYTSNIPLQLANQKTSDSSQGTGDSANKIAELIKSRLLTLDSSDYLEKIEVAGSGFLNFFIKPASLMENLHLVCNYACFVNPDLDLGHENKKILVEYASFNALKPVHVGHMRNIVLGESVSRLLETQGNQIFKVTYTADIGLPSAKVVWGLFNNETEFKKAEKKTLRERAEFLGKIYVEANLAYEESEKAKSEIQEINTKIYQGDPLATKTWRQVLDWTFEYFQTIYELMGTKFDKEILESEVEKEGTQIVKENIGKVFREDEGAVIFPGEEFGLHNRVFISSAGNPTYEAKDMALARREYEAFNFDQAIHVVANDQDEYFKVIFKALEQLDPDLAKKESHLSYGYVFLGSGKMSSRKGNVITLEEIYDEVRERIDQIMDSNNVSDRPSYWHSQDEKDEVIKTVSVGAMKFSILKYAPRTDMTFDLEKSVSLQGDSGPYVQYTYARAKSVLRNAKYDYEVELPHAEAHTKNVGDQLEKEERAVLRLLDYFEVIVSEAAKSFSPNLLTEYLLDLSKAFNLFYQKHPILGSEFRLALTCAVAVTIKQGLNLLGIESPERM